MADVHKIAALSMLSLSPQEAERLRADMAEILDMGAAMPQTQENVPAGCTVGTEALRGDTAEAANGIRLLALSKKARDGFITVCRTVGGDV